jgi:hypothetical protein
MIRQLARFVLSLGIILGGLSWVPVLHPITARIVDVEVNLIERSLFWARYLFPLGWLPVCVALWIFLENRWCDE